MPAVRAAQFVDVPLATVLHCIFTTHCRMCTRFQSVIINNVSYLELINIDTNVGPVSKIDSLY